MTQEQNELILIAIVPEPLKDDVVDSLMAASFLSGFSLSKIQGFSQEHNHYNLSEQVEGYRDFYRFEILHKTDDSAFLVRLLGASSSGNNIRYWVSHLVESGVV